MADDEGKRMMTRIDEMTRAEREEYRDEQKKAGLRLWRLTGLTGAFNEEYSRLIREAQHELAPHEHPLIAVQWQGLDGYAMERTGAQVFAAEVWFHEKLETTGLRHDRKVKVKINGVDERITLSFRGLRVRANKG